MPIYPSSRPVFEDRESYNDSALSISLQRRMADWLLWTYANDLTRTPCDYREWHYHNKLLARYLPVAGGGHRMEVPGATTPVYRLGRWYVPAPRNWSRTLRVMVHLNFGGTYSGTWKLYVKNETTGVVAEYSHSTWPLPEFWVTLDLPASTSCFISIGTTVTGHDKALISSVCAYWVAPTSAPGMAAMGSFYPISTNYPGEGTPLSTYLLRWFTQKANLFAAQKSQQVITSSFPVSGYLVNNVAANAYWHRFKIVVAPYVRQLYIAMICRCDNPASATIKFYINGQDMGGSVTPPSGSWAWRITAIPVVAGNGYFTSPTEVEFSIGHSAVGAGEHLAIANVGVSELGSDATYPMTIRPGDFGFSNPGAFPDLANDRFAARLPMYLDTDSLGRKLGFYQLLRGMHWMWQNRFCQQTVFASLWGGNKTGYSSDLAQEWPIPDFDEAYGKVSAAYAMWKPWERGTGPVTCRIVHASGMPYGPVEATDEYCDVQHNGGSATFAPPPYNDPYIIASYETKDVGSMLATQYDGGWSSICFRTPAQVGTYREVWSYGAQMEIRPIAT